MKFMKYVVTLALALCAFAGQSKAQTIQFLGGGSSALWLELGQAAVGLEGGSGVACQWTQGKTASVVAQDKRPSSTVSEQGNIWIVWAPGSGSCSAPAGSYNVYALMNLDSVLGNRCYFEVDSSGIPGCVMSLTVAANTAGANLLCYPQSDLPSCTTSGDKYADTTGGLPGSIITALNGQHFFIATTDIRPEDAKFATLRALTPCGQAVYRQPFDLGLHQVYGLGYQTGTTGVGTDIASEYTTPTFHVLDFNIAGNDPINTGAAVPSFAVSIVGAQPEVVAVGPIGGSGIGAATDIPLATLALFYDGAIGRSTDLLGPTTANSVTTLVREPLSGTYNVFEFSAVNNNQFHASQDDFNCNGANVANNPLHNNSPAAGGAAYRNRVIGTGEMVKQLNNNANGDRLGYFFWSAGNASGLGNVKYLTVNGVDPLTSGYTDGVLPGNDANHPLAGCNNGCGVGGANYSGVTFKYLNQGDYPIWSALRIISRATVPAGVTNLISAAQSLNTTQFDFITLSNLKVWHSHYYLNAINVNFAANGPTVSTSGDLCSGGTAETGGDAGGSNILKANNSNFCADFGNTFGITLKNN